MHPPKMCTNPSFFPLPRHWPWHEFQVTQAQLPTLQFNWPVFPRPPRTSPTEARMIRVMQCFLRTYLDIPDPDIQANLRFLQLLLILLDSGPYETRAFKQHDHPAWGLAFHLNMLTVLPETPLICLQAIGIKGSVIVKTCARRCR